MAAERSLRFFAMASLTRLLAVQEVNGHIGAALFVNERLFQGGSQVAAGEAELATQNREEGPKQSAVHCKTIG
jgi:hypothetical protein